MKLISLLLVMNIKTFAIKNIDTDYEECVTLVKMIKENNLLEFKRENQSLTHEHIRSCNIGHVTGSWFSIDLQNERTSCHLSVV